MESTIRIERYADQGRCVGHIDGRVVFVRFALPGELVRGGDTSTSCDQDNVVVLVGLPGVLGKRSLKVHALTNGQAVEVFGHGAILVSLDDKVEVAGNVCIL